MMALIKEKISRWSLATVMAAVLALPMLSYGADGIGVIEEEPSALAMTTDALFIRPILFVGTVVGGAALILSSPLSLGGGNWLEAADVLFLTPGKNTFVRCLGCKRAGYKKTLRNNE